MNADGYELRVMAESMRLVNASPDGSRLDVLRDALGFCEEKADTFVVVMSRHLSARFNEVGAEAMLDAFLLGMFTAKAASNINQQDALDMEVPSGP